MSLGGKYKASSLVRGDPEVSSGLGILSATVAMAWGSCDLGVPLHVQMLGLQGPPATFLSYC